MKRLSSLRAAIVLCLLASAPSLAADGNLDDSFAGDGKQTVFFDFGNTLNDHAQAVAGSGDGRIVVVGDVQRASAGDTDIGVAALKPNGDPDLGFSGDGKTQINFDLGVDKADDSHAVAAMRDGRFLVCGSARYSPVINSRLVVARLLPNGNLDPSFGPLKDGTVVLAPFDHPDSHNYECRSIVALNDGRIVVPFVNQPYDQTGLIRLEEDGDLDPTFGGDGISEMPFCGNTLESFCQFIEVLLLPDGKYMAIGTKNVQEGPESVTSLFFARYTSSGLLDMSFNGDGEAIYSVPLQTVDYERPTAAAVGPGGRVVVLASANVPQDSDFHYLVRMDSNGDADASFGTNGWALVELSAAVGDGEAANGLFIQGDGRIVVTGYFHYGGTDYDCGAMRLNSTATSLDLTFGGNGRRGIAFDLGTPDKTDLCRGVSAADGRPVLTGEVMVGSNFNFGAARLTNSYIFVDGFASGSRYFWSESVP